MGVKMGVMMAAPAAWTFQHLTKIGELKHHA
jgi:hypothetical protein